MLRPEKDFIISNKLKNIFHNNKNYIISHILVFIKFCEKKCIFIINL